MRFTSRNQMFTNLSSRRSFPTSRLASQTALALGTWQRCSCSAAACQPQSMAAIPTFTGDGGPILSLTGEQRRGDANDPFCHHLLESRSPLGPPTHSHMPTWHLPSKNYFNCLHLSFDTMSFCFLANLRPTKLAHYRTSSHLADVHVSPIQLGAMIIGDKWQEFGLGSIE